MNANSLNRRTPSARLAGFALALVLSVASIAGISQGMHLERFGHGAPVVELDAVVVTPPQAASATELARADAEARTRATN
jgi:hypothetical protein